MDKLKTQRVFGMLMVGVLTAAVAPPSRAQDGLAIPPPMPAVESASAAEARAIAKEAYLYGFPLVENYRIQFSYFIDTTNPKYKGRWNQIQNTARVYTPEDKTIRTPDCDILHSFVGTDLRGEALVFTVPAVEKERYYSLQFIDQYTSNFGYVGSRATGNDAGSFLLAGPDWKGEKPPGIKDVIRCETEFAFVQFRTQLFNPGDIEAAKKIQAGYKVQRLSEFLGTPPAPYPAPVFFIMPLKHEQERTDPEFFNLLNLVLRFCPMQPSEADLRARFGRIGVGGSELLFVQKNTPAELRQALADGMADAWNEFGEFKTTQLDTGKARLDNGFGTREHLNGHYMDRMASAVLGIYGDSKEEQIAPQYTADSAGEKLDGSKQYTLHFEPGSLPPVSAFWSLTMYEQPSSLLCANPINRYLINSPMLPDLKRDADGGVTIYVQHESPGKEKEANWLPAPSGPFSCVLRLYWPKVEALDGSWKMPAMQIVK